MKRLLESLRKKKRRAIGLMSGTSVDGVDAALVDIEGSGPGAGVVLLAFRTYPYASDVRDRIHHAFEGDVRDICELNFILGEAFAAACLKICAEAGVQPRDVDIIGSPGQTVYHIPKSQPQFVNSTLQVGEAAVIAERTGIPVVCDFRTRDIAAGGDGAPLVPYADFVLFQKPGAVRALQNIGGIANVTVLPGSIDEVFAFDTGPGNMVIDHVARAVARDEEAFDEGGKLSALGRVDEGLLAKLLEHPYLAVPPPKSTGREVFGRAFSQALVDAYDPMRLLDLLATVVHFTAESIAHAYRSFIFPRYAVDEAIVSGGGVHNATLLAALRERLAPVPVRTLEDMGLSSDAKEAVAFAILANETLAGNAGNVPSATGALRPVILGKIVP